MTTNATSRVRVCLAAAAAAVLPLVFSPACSRAPETRPASPTPVAEAAPPPSRPLNEAAPSCDAADAPIPSAIEPVILEPLPPEPEGGGLDGLDAIMLDAITDKAMPEADIRPAPKRKPRAKPRLVAYPFESAFDDGALGRKVAIVITGHAARTRRFDTLPRITQDEAFAAHPFSATTDTEVDEIAAHARAAFDADIAVWGRVTGDRAKPVLEVKALDMRRGGGDGDGGNALGLVLVERYACANIHYVPIFAGEIVAAIDGLEPPRPKYATTVRPLSGNLLANGDFRRGLSNWTPAFPECAKVSGGRLVFTIPKDIAGGHGMSVLSEFIPVEPDARTRRAWGGKDPGETLEDAEP